MVWFTPVIVCVSINTEAGVISKLELLKFFPNCLTKACLEFFFFLSLFIYLFLAVLGLRFCARAFSSCGKQGPLFIAVRGPLTIAASLVAEHRLQTHRLSSCGSRAQLLRSTRDLPRPGLEPVSPALAGGFSTTAPPGKPMSWIFNLLHMTHKVSTLIYWLRWQNWTSACLNTPLMDKE